MRALKYGAPLLIYLGALQSFFSSGLTVWIPLLYSWVLVPLLELAVSPDASNLSAAEEELSRKNRLYDGFLYLVLPLQYLALACFLWSVGREQTWIDLVGKTFVMGLLCGTFGINVAHELGHRTQKIERLMAKALLLTSFYLHFYIEHNKGHHRRVATPEDPSSARFNEWVYRFYFRSIVFGYLSAWRISFQDQKKKGRREISWRNEMVRYQILQLAFAALIGVVWGWLPLALFLAAAAHGILLLETVNYIEHYGLQRRRRAHGGYERTMPHHSWNSNHVIGRVMLFELSRHSDHHYLASRSYQVLRHHQQSPQMPTGYPGMMLLASVPPLWFWVMNPRVRQWMEGPEPAIDDPMLVAITSSGKEADR